MFCPMETTTRQIQRDQRAYTLARKYLLSLGRVTPEMLDRHLSSAMRDKRPETLAGIYKHLLLSAQGATMAPNVIGGAIGGIGKLESLLCGFYPAAVVGKYANDWERVLDDIAVQLKPRGKVRRTKGGLWPRFCKTITSGASFLAGFDAASDFYEWVDSFDQDVESRLSLIERLSDAIHGVGFALACDFVKELGYLNFCKPDVHLKEIFSALDLSPTKGDHQVFKAINRVARNIGVTPYDVDKLFWLIGSGDFYLDGITVGRHRDEFIECAQRELSDD